MNCMASITNRMPHPALDYVTILHSENSQETANYSTVKI